MTKGRREEARAKAEAEAAAKAKAEADAAANAEAEAAAKAKAEADAVAKKEAEVAAAAKKAQALAAEVAEGTDTTDSPKASSPEFESYKPLVMPDANDPLAHLRTGDTVADTYLMPPPNMNRRTSEKPPPIDYDVPTFLRKAKAKAKQRT